MMSSIDRLRGQGEPYKHNILVDAMCTHGLLGLVLTVMFLGSRCTVVALVR